MTETATNQQPTASTAVDYNIESAVLERYQEGARQQQPTLCCPTEYEGNYTEIYPKKLSPKTMAVAIRPAMSMREKL